MPPPTPTPPLRYISHRRLTSPLASAVSDTSRSLGELAATFSAHDAPTNTAATRIRYAPSPSSSEGASLNASAEAEKAAHEESQRRESNNRPGAAPYTPSAAAAAAGTAMGGMEGSSRQSPTQQPTPPSYAPPAGSLRGTHEDGQTTEAHQHPQHQSHNHNSIGGAHRTWSAFDGSVGPGSAASPTNPPSSVEDLHFTLHALRHENAMLRQRVEVLTSSDVTEDGGVASLDGADVSREVLVRRIARLEAALRLEALERDVVEQRLLAQERVLRAVCTPAHAPNPAASVE